jgi:uncharacterized protein
MPLDVPASRGQACWSGFVEPEAGLALPCTIIRGTSPGPKLVITAGVHGAEYSSIEAARRLGALATDALAGEVLILPIVNIDAFWKHQAFVNPRDGKNINRVFPGDAQGSPSERLAAWLTGTVIAGADAYVDLHCGDMTEALTPFSVFPDGNERSLELAIASGIPYAVRSGAKGHSYSGAVGVGVPGLILESGANGLWTEGSVSPLVDGVKRIMVLLGMLPKGAVAAAPRPTVCSMAVTASPVAGFWHPAVAPGATVERGAPVGTIHDLVGRWERPIVAEHAGPVLFHSTSLAVSEGEALVGIAV